VVDRQARAMRECCSSAMVDEITFRMRYKAATSITNLLCPRTFYSSAHLATGEVIGAANARNARAEVGA
jgi:hypothetical protein